jgi:pimeloyl-ACP methyl ester carboxylesterase
MAMSDSRTIDVGSGPPLVLIPGLHGRWEWMRPTVAALSKRFRVLTFSLAGERSSRYPLDPRIGFDSFLSQIDQVMDRAAVPSAFVCGVSYGGLVAMRYAGTRPDRVKGLALASALAPGFVPDARARFYMRAPRLLMPLFFVDGCRRSRREVRAALPRLGDRLRFGLRQSWYVATALPTPSLMRDRLRLLDNVDFSSAAANVTAPALVITGDPDLDSVVPVNNTLRYERLLPRVEVVHMRGTGHHGTLTQPEDFARHLDSFATRVSADAGPRQGGMR